MSPKKIVFSAAFAALPLAAFAHTRVGIGLNFGFPIYDYEPPPRVYVVQQPVVSDAASSPAPGPDYVWISGHWERDMAANRWVWYSAAWQHRPSPTAIWQAGYWSQRNGGWMWVNSHWAEPTPAAAPATTTPPQPPATAPSPSAQSYNGAQDAPPQQEVVVNERPPNPVVEEIYTAPGPDYVWIGGSWVWNDAWVWAPGHYVRPPYRGAVWIGGSWAHHDRGYAWVGGHWRR